MDKEQQENVRVVVEEILAEADMMQVSEKQVRELAAKKTGIDLSASREWKKFVSNVIKKYMESGVDASDAEADEAKKSPPPEQRNSKKMKESEELKKTEELQETKDDEVVEDEENEDDEEEAGAKGRKGKYETDEEGNSIICELSAKRKVVVSQWRGKTLVSMREYYEKDGKSLPGKGISLTAEQFQILAKSAKNIDEAIATLS